MLDMGFFDDIMQVVNRLPKERQTIMFSATMPPKIRQLAKTILHDPVEVKIAVSRPPESIMQTAYICYEAQKPGIVRHLFADQALNKVIIFSGSKLKVKELFKTFRQMGLSVGEMHSDLDQTQRDHIMHEFKNNRVNILVATDIVSRGIDIDDISLIINYDVPHDAEDYVHRIGRTARASAKGMSITFVSEDEQYKFKQIENFLEKIFTKSQCPKNWAKLPNTNPNCTATDIKNSHQAKANSIEVSSAGKSYFPFQGRQNYNKYAESRSFAALFLYELNQYVYYIFVKGAEIPERIKKKLSS